MKRPVQRIVRPIRTGTGDVFKCPALKDSVELCGEYRLLVKCLLVACVDYLAAKALTGSTRKILWEARLVEMSKNHRSKLYGTTRVLNYLARYKRTQAKRRMIERGADAIRYIWLPINSREAQEYVFSFYNICALLGLNHQKLQKRLKAYTRKRIKKELSCMGFQGFTWRA